MVDSTDFRSGGNENAASRLDCRGRLLKKAANEAAGERKPEAYPQGYVEDAFEGRTPLAGFFSSLVRRFFDTDASAPPTHQKSRGRHCRDCRYR